MLAIGATATAVADGLSDRSVAVAALASVVAGAMTLSLALSRDRSRADA
jgi:hypothetical protein